MKLRKLLLFPRLFISVNAIAEQPAIIYGDAHVFTVDTPSGWTLDRELAKRNGLVHMIYPSSESALIENYIYAIGWGRDSGNENIEKFIEADIKQFKDLFPGIKDAELKIQGTRKPNKYLTGKMKLIEFTNFPKSSGKYAESVFYCETNKSIITIAFSSHTSDSHDKYFPAYQAVINSFNFISDSPQEFFKEIGDKGIQLH
jgi:hypothetical protein